MLARQTQATTNMLGANVTLYSPAARAMFAQTRAAFMASGADPTTATNRAYAAMFGMVQRQASMVSFVSIFQLLGFLFFALLPLILLMRRPKHQGAPVAAH